MSMKKGFLSKVRIPIGMLILYLREDWEILEVNEALLELFECQAEEFQGGKKIWEFIYSKDADLLREMLTDIRTRKHQCKIEVRRRRKNGKLVWLQVTGCCYDVECDENLVVLLFSDVSKQKENESYIRLLKKQLESMSALGQEIPFLIDVSNQAILRSKKFEIMCGVNLPSSKLYPLEEEVDNVIHPMDRGRFLSAMKAASEKEMSDLIEYRVNTNLFGGEPLYRKIVTHYQSIYENGQVIRIIGRSYNVEEHSQLPDENRKDSLTKTLSKITIEQEIIRQIEKDPNGKYVMFLLDIDNLKAINDTFGHTFGDTIIVDVANLIRDAFQETDLIGRVGGDEFLIFASNMLLEEAKTKAKQLCQILCKEYTGEGVIRSISVSIGISVYGRDGMTFRGLFEKADHAMYRAKNEGKNTYSIARLGDIGIIPRDSQTNELENVPTKKDTEFLNFASHLMMHARNIDGSLNLLLKHIASKWELDLVCIFENQQNHTMVLTNYNSEVFSFYEKTLFKSNVKEIETAEAEDLSLFYGNSLIESGLGSQLFHGNRMDMQDVSYAMIVAKYNFLGGKTGELCLMSLEKERVWTPDELETLKELVKTISIFVSLRSRMEESDAQIRNMQKRDQLTGLFNLEAFKSRCYNILDTADANKVYAVCYFDFNNFGYINEHYGYKVGDNVLKCFVKHLMNQTLFLAGCRLYSDFFIFLFTEENLQKLEENIQYHMKQFVSQQNNLYPSSGLSTAIGVVPCNPENPDLDIAIENATLAWKMAKYEKHNALIFFEESMRTTKTMEQKIVGEFFEALYRQEFKIYLQPKFNLKTNVIYGAEALTRWQRPDGSIMTPNLFMPLIEKIGYVRELDFNIFERMIAMMKRWKETGNHPLVISVNFSGIHFQKDTEEFYKRIIGIIEKYQVDPSLVEIEITENILIKNLADVQKCLTMLREKGIRIAIDDFGTGYSSLGVLLDIPSDVIKIDKAFIDRCFHEKGEEMLVQIGNLIRVAGKEILFEGIETPEQAQLLVKNNFIYGQGYLCNQPIPDYEFEALYLQ